MFSIVFMLSCALRIELVLRAVIHQSTVVIRAYTLDFVLTLAALLLDICLDMRSTHSLRCKYVKKVRSPLRFLVGHE